MKYSALCSIPKKSKEIFDRVSKRFEAGAQKKIMFVILILIFCCPLNLYSESMKVSGAGTAEVNGYYTNMGTHPTDSDGVDYYQKDDIYVPSFL